MWSTFRLNRTFWASSPSPVKGAGTLPQGSHKGRPYGWLNSPRQGGLMRSHVAAPTMGGRQTRLGRSVPVAIESWFYGGDGLSRLARGGRSANDRGRKWSLIFPWCSAVDLTGPGSRFPPRGTTGYHEGGNGSGCGRRMRNLDSFGVWNQYWEYFDHYSISGIHC